MTTQAVRDPIGDALLTPDNCALIIIDYQPIQVSSVMSMDHGLLVANIVRVAKTAKAYGLPIVVSTVNVKTGRNKPLIPELREVLPDVEPVDRTTMRMPSRRAGSNSSASCSAIGTEARPSSRLSGFCSTRACRSSWLTTRRR